MFALRSLKVKPVSAVQLSLTLAVRVWDEAAPGSTPRISGPPVAVLVT